MSNGVQNQNPNQLGQQQPQTAMPGINDNLVQFRIKPEQVAFFRRLTQFLYENGFIQEPTLNRMAYMCMMIGKKFEKQESANLQRLVEKRLADARAKASPRFHEQFLYVQPQPAQATQKIRQEPRAPPVSAILPGQTYDLFIAY